MTDLVESAWMRKIMGPLLALSLLLPLAADTGQQLVHQVLWKPGFDSQNCRGPIYLNGREIPINGYHRVWADTSVSPQNFLKLRSQRREVVHEVARRLDGLNVQQCLQRFYHGEVLLMIVLDLNGVEDLSALLRLEKGFDEVAPYRRGQPLPAKVTAYSPHVQVLSVITAILHNERYPGIEKLGKAVPYDRAHRDRIIALAEGFLRDVEPEQYRRDRGMAARPVVR